MSIKETPCRFCNKRTVECHTNCEQYIKWKEELNDYNNKVKESRKKLNANHFGKHFFKNRRR